MSIYYKKIILFVLLLAFRFIANGQNATLSGKVIDLSGKPLGFATIAIEGTDLGATANIEGLYSLSNIPIGENTVVVSFLGYESTKKQIDLKSGASVSLDFTLTESINTMDEVVVTGTMKAVNRFESPVPVEVYRFNVGEKASVLTGVNYFNFDNVVDNNDDNFTDRTIAERVSVFQKWNFKRKDNRLFTLAGRYYWEDRWGGELDWTSVFRGGDEIYGEAITTKRWELLGQYQLPTVENMIFSFSFNTHDQNSVYGDVPYIADQKIGFGQLTWDKEIKNHDLLIGTALRYTYYDDNTPATASAENIDVNNPDEIWLPGVFVQDEIALNQRHKMLLGLRYDYNDVHGSILTPRLAYKWSISKTDIFRLNAGTGFRVVNLFTEDHAALTGAREVVITEDLEPEQSYNINVNYIKKMYLENGGSGSIELSGWYTYFTNVIFPDFETNTNQIIYDNLNGHAVTKGVSFNADLSLPSGFSFFSHDGKNIITLSDESGEFEFVQFAANGSGAIKALSNDGNLLRYQGIPSPDGKWIAYDDLEANMYVLNVATGISKKISTNQEGIRDFSWSPDSRWIAYVQAAFNTMTQIKIYNVNDESTFDLTTDRANSFNPKWSPDGKFMYFLSDRSFTSLVGSPWGTRQPEPYWDASEKIYHVALKKGTRSPFREKDELMEEEKSKKEAEKDKKEQKDKSKKSEEKLVVKIDKTGIQSRIMEVPVSAGNYSNLTVNDKALYLMARETGIKAKSHLKVVKITNEAIKIKDVAASVNGFEITQDGKKLLIRKGKSYYMVDAGTGSAKLDDGKIDFSGWKFSINPQDDWKQVFTDAWRMERDYFYDKNMHGVDWDGMYKKYLPLVNRITTRNELSDLIGRLIGELSALHTGAGGGDLRSDNKRIQVASLGAKTSRDTTNGGFRIDYIYKSDPDYPNEKSPLDDPYLDIRTGDIITKVNGRDALSAIDIGELIRNQTGKQVRLSLKRDTSTRDVIVKPSGSDFWLRYRDWEYGNRLKVEKDSDDQIGYLHLSAMGSRNINQFYREFYPVFNRKGLIIDVRYNWGGNIDAFILEKLMRKAWMYWKARSGKPYWNMQYAFRGHIIVLVNENTYSDGETFAEGFKRLGLGTTIGTRTWGGQIWLHSGNRLTDNGIARAPMFGVYGPEGKWLIEGRGYVPDIELDNLPHETFKGKDAQLEAAIKLLQQKIEAAPREVPPVPGYPNKAFKNNRKN